MLNYYIGKRAADEGRYSPYPDIDFCKDPGAVCSRTDHPELKWIGEFVCQSISLYIAYMLEKCHVSISFEAHKKNVLRYTSLFHPLEKRTNPCSFRFQLSPSLPNIYIRLMLFFHVAGMFYWIRSVQTYESGGWNYIDNLKAFVRGGLTDDSFIDGVSGIVNRVSADEYRSYLYRKTVRAA